MAFGFIWYYGKLIQAMATSRLLPPVLAKVSARYETPHIALIAGPVLGYSVCAIVYLNGNIGQYLYSVCITSAFVSYSGQCTGYIVLKKSYKNVKSSHFKSPFSVYGAVYSMTIWMLGLISVIGFQGNGGIDILAFGILAAIVTAFYFGYARKRQQFSPQENKVLLVTHVIKFNVNRIAGKKATPPSRSKATASARSQVSSTTNNNVVSQIRIKPGKTGSGGAVESSTTRVSVNESKGRSAF